MTDKLTIRDVDETDVDVLRTAAQDDGVSLNRYVVRILHEQAQREHHRRLFAEIAAQQPDIADFDAVSEVRAMRDAKDAADDDNDSELAE